MFHDVILYGRNGGPWPLGMVGTVPSREIACSEEICETCFRNNDRVEVNIYFVENDFRKFSK